MSTQINNLPNLVLVVVNSGIAELNPFSIDLCKAVFYR